MGRSGIPTQGVQAPVLAEMRLRERYKHVVFPPLGQKPPLVWEERYFFGVAYLALSLPVTNKSQKKLKVKK